MSIYELYISEAHYLTRCQQMTESVAAGNKPQPVKLPPVQTEPTLDEIFERR